MAKPKNNAVMHGGETLDAISTRAVPHGPLPSIDRCDQCGAQPPLVHVPRAGSTLCLRCADTDQPLWNTKARKALVDAAIAALVMRP